jgi:molybdopterin-binding protein
MLALSVLSVSSVRTLFYKTGTKAYRAVAKRRGSYASMLALSVLSVSSVRTLFYKTGTKAYRAVAK